MEIFSKEHHDYVIDLAKKLGEHLAEAEFNFFKINKEISHIEKSVISSMARDGFFFGSIEHDLDNMHDSLKKMFLEHIKETFKDCINEMEKRLNIK